MKRRETSSIQTKRRRFGVKPRFMPIRFEWLEPRTCMAGDLDVAFITLGSATPVDYYSRPETVDQSQSAYQSYIWDCFFYDTNQQRYEPQPCIDPYVGPRAAPSFDRAFNWQVSYQLSTLQTQSTLEAHALYGDVGSDQLTVDESQALVKADAPVTRAVVIADVSDVLDRPKIVPTRQMEVPAEPQRPLMVTKSPSEAEPPSAQPIAGEPAPSDLVGQPLQPTNASNKHEKTSPNRTASFVSTVDWTSVDLATAKQGHADKSTSDDQQDDARQLLSRVARKATTTSSQPVAQPHAATSRTWLAQAVSDEGWTALLPYKVTATDLVAADALETTGTATTFATATTRPQLLSVPDLKTVDALPVPDDVQQVSRERKVDAVAIPSIMALKEVEFSRPTVATIARRVSNLGWRDGQLEDLEVDELSADNRWGLIPAGPDDQSERYSRLWYLATLPAFIVFSRRTSTTTRKLSERA